ncbi:LisH protein [Ancylostoma duodenale]|uniref:LisH protein n=1 Tax=Ancylostoma duodenale TaxID=51022 RepID=A0A0C2FS71_9BILA|nr:LisH protein [Ancylostoma duodenale]
MLEKRSEHVKFCEEARKLIETVTQRPMMDQLTNPKDLTQVAAVVTCCKSRLYKRNVVQDRLWKSHVIANTRVSYNEKELLQLIHDHLVRKGLHATAAQLVNEAELPDVPASRAPTTPARLPPMSTLQMLQPRTHSLALPPSQPRSLVLPGASGLTSTSASSEATTPINSVNKRHLSISSGTSQRDQGFLEPSPGRVRKTSWFSTSSVVNFHLFRM